MDLHRLERPVFLVDPVKAKGHIARMGAKAAASGVVFRPHFKTHQSAGIGEWFRAAGVRAITVSSLDMARYFAGHGWDDILIAIPVNVHQVPSIDALAAKVGLGVIVDSTAAADRLVSGTTNPLRVRIEVDTGHLRTGVPIEDPDAMAEIARRLRPGGNLSLEGILVHAGHAYAARGADAVRAVHEASVAALGPALDALAAHGFPGLTASIGDTPSCSLVDRFGPPVSEIRPGNFVFYDLMQVAIGSCRMTDIAGAVACPVISVHPERNEAILYGGGVHVALERAAGPDGTPSFGRICRLASDGRSWGAPLEGVSLASVSQEHGIVRGPRGFAESVALGDTLVVLPIHSCMTADLFGEYWVMGEGAVGKLKRGS